MNRDTNILVVEDDPDINDLLHKILTKKGYRVRSAYSGSEAKLCLQQEEYHIVLLDLMIPGVTGEQLISEIRSIATIPIIVISAKPGRDIKIQVLKLGADDFISKPFDIEEVVARVQAQLRRYLVFSNGDNNSKILKYKNLSLNTETFKVEVKGQGVAVTSREFEILRIMLSYPNKVFTKANLFESVWDSEYLGDDNTVNVHISNLRSKLAKIDPQTEYIHTVWGIGFKISDKT